jgi:hypothetical protein
MGRSSRWLIFLPVALFALFAPQPAEASQTGLLVRGYQITEVPPTKSDLAYPLCGSSVEPFINATWDYEQNLFGDCGWDLFMLHYTGYLQIPEHETIEFWIASDDGGTVKIGLEEFGVWQDQGCSATETGLIDIAAGTQPVDAWFYENGGGTCFMLAWNIDDTGWAIVQPEFFTSEPLPSATTSTLETTTTGSTTTTSTSTTTSTTSTTTTEPSTTTTEMPVSTTTTSIYLPSTTAQPQTTSTIPETTSSVTPLPIPQPVAEVVATTSIPATTTIPEPLPETTLTTSPQVTSTVLPSLTIPATTIPVLPPVSVSSAPETTTSLYAPPETGEPLTQEQFVEALTALSEATPDQVAEIVDTILNSEVTSDQAEQLVAAVEVLSVITGEQAQELFQAIEPAQLSESMAAVISDAMNDPAVPDEVKEAFEETLNIFSNDGFSTYVPLGSNVNVAVRRTIIAGTTILVAMPSPAPARRT